MAVPRQVLLLTGCVLTTFLSLACERAEAVEQIPAGTEVTVVTQDGALVRGKLAKVEPELITLTSDRTDAKTEIARESVTEVKRVVPADDAPAAAARVLTISVPEGADLDAELTTALASDSSRIEAPVRATVTAPVMVDGVTAIPAGSTLVGHVTTVDDSGRVKGRAELGFRFTRLQVGPVTYDIATQPLYYRAASTKKDDAVKIGVGAAAGAIVGAITGGKKGAAIGTAVGAGGGTAVVLATDGDEIRLASGRKLKVSLSNPLIIRSR